MGCSDFCLCLPASAPVLSPLRRGCPVQPPAGLTSLGSGLWQDVAPGPLRALWGEAAGAQLPDAAWLDAGGCGGANLHC